MKLTATELGVLTRAAVLADRIRARCIELDPDATGGVLGDELARISIAVDELSGDPAGWGTGFVPVVITPRPFDATFHEIFGRTDDDYQPVDP